MLVPLSHWARVAGRLYRPRIVFEDLRAHPHWIPPAMLAALAGSLVWSAHRIFVALQLARQDIGYREAVLDQIVEIVEDPGEYVFWFAVLSCWYAVYFIGSVLL